MSAYLTEDATNWCNVKDLARGFALDSLGITFIPDVQFEVADATKREYQPESFDDIYSRETIIHIPDKLALFTKFDGEHSEVFKSYVKQRQYTLLSPTNYGTVLEKAGFVNVQADDWTDLFVTRLEQDVVKIESIKTEFFQEFNEDDYDYLVNGLKDTVEKNKGPKMGSVLCRKEIDRH